MSLAGEQRVAVAQSFVRRARRAAASAVLLLLAAGAASAATSFKQAGFSETAVFTGLTNPTVVRFLPDGRVLVAEKSGLLKIFPDINTNSFTVVADLRTEVHNFWDRGLLGLAIDPNFASNNYVYVLYSYDAPIGGSPPRWGVAGQTSDGCPTPPGANTDGCVISGRLSRLTATGASWTASETPLINDWCQQFPSHSIGSLDFGADGYLYVSGGDGASFNNADWGQYGGTSGAPPPIPANPCGDPPFPIGTPQTKPTAEGGALRSQSHLRTAGEPRVLNGSILRIDPATGLAAPGNPLIGSGDVNEQRIIGYGLRNPFRMIVRPGTNEVWISDVGWSTWEELDKIPDLTAARNFGWPCYEGNAVQYTGLNICPPQAQTTAPILTYNHSASVVPGDGCPTGSSSVAGLAFYEGGSNYPSGYPNSLFFSDYSRKCLWVMFADGGGNPNPGNVAAFASSAQGPVDLRIGPDGNLFYVDYDGGRVMEVKYGLAAVATASPTSGNAPLTVNFDGSGSVPAQSGDTLTYAWDLDGDGQFDDSSAQKPTFVYSTPGTYTARLQVTDQRGGSSTSSPITISAGNTAPTAFIDTPPASLTWKVGDTISFTGHATDDQDGTLPASALSWQVIIHHCPSNCHTHVYQTFPGVAGGSFPAPDHEYPSYLEIQLTATDTQGLTGTASVNLQPQTASLMFQTSPTGLQLTVGTSPPQATPFTQTVIVNSVNAVQATSPQGALPNIWQFSSWSDGGAQNHNITAPAGSSSYTATYLTHADLSVSASVAPEPVGAGLPMTYTISVSNAGPSQANSVTLTDTIPSGSSFVSAGGAGWACSGTGPVTCTLAALPPGAAAPVTLVVNAPSEGGAVSNTATVASATDDPSSGNNAATTPSTVFARADLSIGQTGAPAAICAGAPITYALNVSNAGPSTATTLTVTDTLPAGATLVSASGAGWSCSGSATVTCTRPSLSPGAAPAITVAITAPSAAGTATNAASVSSPVNDPSPGNNAGNASTTVNAIPPAPTAGNNGPVCVGGTLQLTASTVAGATYSWTGPNGFSSSLQNPTIPGVTAAAAGLYSVTVTVSGCVSPAGTTTAVVNPIPPAPTAGNNGPVCVGGTLQLTASTVAGATYSWTGPNGFSSSLQNPTIAGVTAAAAGLYSVTVTVSGCASSAGTTTVVVNPIPPAPTAGNNGPVCVGGTLQLTASTVAGATYSWTGPNGFSSSLQNPTIPGVTAAAAGLYSVTVTVSGCASSAGTTTVVVNPIPPAPTAGNNGPVCVGGTLQLTASNVAGATYSWTGPNGFSSSLQNPTIPGVTAAAAGLYTVTVDVSGCGSAAGSTTVSVLPLPSAVVSGDATICPGSSTEISAALTGTGPWNLIWSDGLAQSVGASPGRRTVSPASTTVYTVTSVQDALCTAAGTGSATVTVAPPVPAPAISAASWVPVGATGVPASAPAHDGSTYAWTLSGGTIASGQGSAAVTLDAGTPGTTMVLACTETSAPGCVSPEGSAKIQVDFLDVPPAHPFHDFVDTIARDGITAGCGGGNYCPGAPNTRAQMAVFLLKSKHGAAYTPPACHGMFADVPCPGGFAVAWIEQLANEGVTSGCGNGNYCPGAPVTRAQMAVFLLKALLGASYLPPPATGIFGDVPVGAFAADWIEDLYGRSITGGCQASPLLYCPNNPNTRGQMAVFLVKTFGLP